MPDTPTVANEPAAPDSQLKIGLVNGDEFDALADLFLGPDEATPAAPAGRSAPLEPGAVRPEIELLVQGHLPIRAGPWSLQYARVRAEQTGGAAALVRFSPEELVVEQVGGASPAHPHNALEEAIRAARSRITTFLVQANAPASPTLIADPRLTGVTLLTADNDAAVVAAYRTIKEIAPALSPGVEVRVAFVSRSRDAANDALSRLRDAVALFLDRPLRPAGVIERIAPTCSACLFRGEFRGGAAEVLDLLTAAPPPRQERIVGAAPGPAVARRASDPSSAAADRPALSSLIPGLRPAEFGWPDDPAVELARDAEGRWHALRDDFDGKGVEGLVAAGAWLFRHRALVAAAAGIGRASQGRSIAHMETPPVLHLFTATPKEARRLLDAELRVHLLAPAAGEWCCVDLN